MGRLRSPLTFLSMPHAEPRGSNMSIAADVGPCVRRGRRSNNSQRDLVNLTFRNMIPDYQHQWKVVFAVTNLFNESGVKLQIQHRPLWQLPTSSIFIPSAPDLGTISSSSAGRCPNLSAPGLTFPPAACPGPQPKVYLVFLRLQQSDLTARGVRSANAAKNAGPAKVPTQLTVSGHTEDGLAWGGRLQFRLSAACGIGCGAT